jgi:hypothetical protein
MEFRSDLVLLMEIEKVKNSDLSLSDKFSRLECLGVHSHKLKKELLKNG